MSEHAARTCTDCGMSKAVTEFYRNRKLQCGIRATCHDCQRLRNRAYRRAWRIGNKHKQRAHTKVRKAVNNGTLPVEPCVVCGNHDAQAHHRDYGRPYDIVWLCPKHHSAVHNGDPAVVAAVAAQPERVYVPPPKAGFRRMVVQRCRRCGCAFWRGRGTSRDVCANTDKCNRRVTLGYKPGYKPPQYSKYTQWYKELVSRTGGIETPEVVKAIGARRSKESHHAETQ